jgi:hypothetical protein
MFGFSKKKFQVNLSSRKKPFVSSPPSSPSRASWRRVFFLLAILSAITASVYVVATKTDFFQRAGLLKKVQQANSPQPAVGNTIESVVDEVNKQYLLPTGEIPTMALITSLDELQGQAFFAKAQVDDIVLMYMQAKKGILWRPSTRQIVEVGPILATEPPAGTVDSDIQKEN